MRLVVRKYDVTLPPHLLRGLYLILAAALCLRSLGSLLFIVKTFISVVFVLLPSVFFICPEGTSVLDRKAIILPKTPNLKVVS